MNRTGYLLIASPRGNADVPTSASESNNVACSFTKKFVFIQTFMYFTVFAVCVSDVSLPTPSQAEQKNTELFIQH